MPDYIALKTKFEQNLVELSAAKASRLNAFIRQQIEQRQKELASTEVTMHESTARTRREFGNSMMRSVFGHGERLPHIKSNEFYNLLVYFVVMKSHKKFIELLTHPEYIAFLNKNPAIFADLAAIEQPCSDTYFIQSFLVRTRDELGQMEVRVKAYERAGLIFTLCFIFVIAPAYFVMVFYFPITAMVLAAAACVGELVALYYSHSGSKMREECEKINQIMKSFLHFEDDTCSLILYDFDSRNDFLEGLDGDITESKEALQDENKYGIFNYGYYGYRLDETKPQFMRALFFSRTVLESKRLEESEAQLTQTARHRRR